MKKSFYALFIASVTVSASAQVPSQTYHQQAVLGNGTPITVQNLQGLQVIPENAPTMTPKAYETRRAIRSKQISVNANGEAFLSGAIRGLGMDVYHFSGNAGDSIDILNQSGGAAMEFAIFRPDIGQRFGNYQVLPESGDYELRIVNNRSNLPKNKKAYPYQVKFTLRQGNGQYIAPAATTAKTIQPVRRAAPVQQVAPVAAVAASNSSVTPPSSAPITHYTCAQGGFEAGITAKQQAVFVFKGQRAVLPFQPAASNAQTGVYGAGPLILETVGYGVNPQVARLIANGSVSATNCVAR